MNTKIIFDIGHAEGTGARGNGHEEHDLCTKIVNQLADRLRKIGYDIDVIDFPSMTNRGDLNATVRISNALQGALFGVSWHMDASANASARGGHVCYISKAGKLIADAIASELDDYMPGRAETVQRRSNLYVLNATSRPWALVEIGFLTNPLDLQKMVDNPATEHNELEPLMDVLTKAITKAAKAIV